MEIKNTIFGAVIATAVAAALAFAGNEFLEFKNKEEQMYKNMKAVYEKHWQVSGRVCVMPDDGVGEPKLWVNRKGPAEHYKHRAGGTNRPAIVTELYTGGEHQFTMKVSEYGEQDDCLIGKLSYAAAKALTVDYEALTKPETGGYPQIRIQLDRLEE